MTRYRLHPSAPEFEIMDGPRKGRTYRRGQAYALEDIPPEHAGRFEPLQKPAAPPPAPDNPGAQPAAPDNVGADLRVRPDSDAEPTDAEPPDAEPTDPTEPQPPADKTRRTRRKK